MLKIDKLCSHTFIASFLDKDSTIIDLGVNYGEFSETMVKEYGCTVHGVEPVPSLFSKLPQSKNMIVHQFAISDHEGSINIRVNPNRCASVISILKEEEGDDIIVPCTTLDSFISDRVGKQRIDLLKVDIEGAEIKALMGCNEDTLKKIGMLTVEFHDFLDSSLTPLVEKVHLKMENVGFYRINYSLDNTDVLYVNLLMHPLSLADKTSLIYGKYLAGIKRWIHR